MEFIVSFIGFIILAYATIRCGGLVMKFIGNFFNNIENMIMGG